MKFIPILFSTPMVQALLAGRKTMTRRTRGLEVVNDEPDYYRWCDGYEQMEIPREAVKYDTKFYYGFTGKYNNSSLAVADCPFGKQGDVLWVRETFMPLISSPYGKYGFRADLTDNADKLKWKPNIFMPKEACRIFLKVTSVRPERLQDITEADAIAEGVESWVDTRLKSQPTRYKVYQPNDDPEALYSSAAYDSFLTLWQSINGIESWDANPWVWVIEFKKIERPVNFLV